jgi:hypothetical protein
MFVQEMYILFIFQNTPTPTSKILQNLTFTQLIKNPPFLEP